MTPERFFYLFTRSYVLYPFIAGIAVSLIAAVIGVSLVQKRYSMIGDGLSHVGFASLAISSAVGMAGSLWISLPIVTVSAVCLLRLRENNKVKGDAAIAILSTGALAVGTIIAQKSTGLGGDVCNYMFGSTSIFAMTPGDFVTTVVLALVMLVLYLFFYHKFFLVSFDESFGKAIGVRVSFYNTFLAILTAVTIVIGMKMMGAMLISSLIVFPTLTAVRFCKTFRSVTIAAGILSVCTYVVGFALSIALSTPPGATIVIVDIAVFLLFCAIGVLKNHLKRG
ncbi:MAG: metal ABC transporter permease [Clostridia bacterium]|nr:metal ABC transporter permease [Clostridia bacterium]